MTLAVVRTRAIDGLDAPAVLVEAHLANGLPSFTLVGLADTEVKEARERLYSTLAHCGLSLPANSCIAVTLTPADLANELGRFDLPIALCILAAQGQLDAAALDNFEFVGGLSAMGELRPVRGALALALAMRHEGSSHALVLSEASATEAALAERVDVRSARNIIDVVAAFRLDGDAQPLVRAQPPRASLAMQPLDMRDIRGQASAKRVLEIAATGNHHVLMVGPPGTAKSMLAQRVCGLLPPMAENEALANAAIASLSGLFDPDIWMVRPYRAPRHTATIDALVGGGTPLRPGELSLAYAGVLFVDELPAFSDDAIEALSEALETGRITLPGEPRQPSFPARFQLIAGTGQCPCGYAGAPAGIGHVCHCDPEAVSRYQSRVPTALLDHFDLQVEVPAVRHEELTGATDGESTLVVAVRVAEARARQIARQSSWNADLAADAIDAHCALDDVGHRLLTHAAQQMHVSRKGALRVLKVARTIADLAGKKTIASMHLAEALQYRAVLSVRPDR